MGRFGDRGTLWLFGYGSLIWKADFAWIKRRSARILGWSRRFWQGSHDHRGTEDAPGRVVTLIRDADAVCAGAAYLITPEVFDYLDHREKNGYLRHAIEIHFDDDSSVEGLVYIATDANPAFLGPAPATEIARHIARASGPSGSNRDYLSRLAGALRDMNADDPHVFAIERQLLALADDAASD
ncbi:MAG: gamma-glutamylcyclotransferase [Rhodanobacteraceae bacterium]